VITTEVETRPAAEPSVLVPYAPSSVGPARRALSADLGARGLSTTLIEDTALVLSEMLSNALRHASPLPDSGRVRLGWTVERANGSDSASVTLLVSDGGGSTRPRVLAATRSETGGRGMGIVETLADDWGIRPNGRGTTVWATLVDGSRRRNVVVLPK
jgi:anti-sigma regulatory factor (Ser/Thr protein kinase)